MSAQKEIATFAAGCFWGVELAFKRKFPAIATRVGYTGGHVPNATYKQVCAGTTGHAEALQIGFDPSVTKYRDLVDFFYRMHDPTTKDRQGNDWGSQYRSAIYTHSEEQNAVAKEVTEYAQEYYGDRRIATEIASATTFYDAEDYHQDYLNKNPNGYHCSTHFERTWSQV